MRRGGFLLLEACITIAVVSVGLVYLARSFATSANALGAVQNYAAAVAVLEEQLALIRAQDGVAPGRTSGTAAWPSIDREFAWAVDITEPAVTEGPPEAPVLPAAVAVSWTERRGTVQLEAETLLPRRPAGKAQGP